MENITAKLFFGDPGVSHSGWPVAACHEKYLLSLCAYVCACENRVHFLSPIVFGMPNYKADPEPGLYVYLGPNVFSVLYCLVLFL